MPRLAEVVVGLPGRGALRVGPLGEDVPHEIRQRFLPRLFCQGRAHGQGLVAALGVPDVRLVLPQARSWC